jgi:hypothetical protein
MVKRFLGSLFLLGLLASCVSAPPPNTESSRQKAAVQNELNANAQNIVKGETGSPPIRQDQAPQAPAKADQAPTPSPQNDLPFQVQAQLTPEEQQYLEQYLTRLKYMVYYDEKAEIPADQAKTAVAQANRYLIEQMKLEVIDFDQIMKNKEDQKAAYQKETGGKIDLIQYLAQKFNADVYVELSFSVNSTESSGKYYATATGSMKIFNPSTASLLGSITFQSPQVMWQSKAGAVQNALNGSVWQAMPKLTAQAKELIKGTLQRGFRYELIIQQTADSRLIDKFERQLAKKMREVEQVSYSAEETRYDCFTFQTGSKFKQAVQDAADAAGLKDLYTVYSRGKSYTFNTGL